MGRRIIVLFLDLNLESSLILPFLHFLLLGSSCALNIGFTYPDARPSVGHDYYNTTDSLTLLEFSQIATIQGRHNYFKNINHSLIKKLNYVRNSPNRYKFKPLQVTLDGAAVYGDEKDRGVLKGFKTYGSSYTFDPTSYPVPHPYKARLSDLPSLSSPEFDVRWPENNLELSKATDNPRLMRKFLSSLKLGFYESPQAIQPPSLYEGVPLVSPNHRRYVPLPHNLMHDMHHKHLWDKHTGPKTLRIKSSADFNEQHAPPFNQRIPSRGDNSRTHDQRVITGFSPQVFSGDDKHWHRANLNRGQHNNNRRKSHDHNPFTYQYRENQMRGTEPIMVVPWLHGRSYMEWYTNMQQKSGRRFGIRQGTTQVRPDYTPNNRTYNSYKHKNRDLNVYHSHKHPYKRRKITPKIEKYPTPYRERYLAMMRRKNDIKRKTSYEKMKDTFWGVNYPKQIRDKKHKVHLNDGRFDPINSNYHEKFIKEEQNHHKKHFHQHRRHRHQHQSKRKPKENGRDFGVHKVRPKGRNPNRHTKDSDPMKGFYDRDHLHGKWIDKYHKPHHSKWKSMSTTKSYPVYTHSPVTPIYPSLQTKTPPAPEDRIVVPQTTVSTVTAHLTTQQITTKPPRDAQGPGDKPPYRQRMDEYCGVQASPYIIGGQKSREGNWPWQVSLQIVASALPWHRCGGVLIHERWVLTAAHCMEGPFYGDISNWRVVMADYDLDIVSGKEIYRKITRIISHPGYVRTSNFPNDVALLQLDSPVDLTTGEVGIACLPDINFDLSPGTKCWISGWGETRGSGGKEAQMNELAMSIEDTGKCKVMWSRVDIEVLDSQICLGDGLTGACYGDSGGPLMCAQKGRTFVAGVMSWLIKNCSGPYLPNVFTRLPSYITWLEHHMDDFEAAA